MGWTSCRGCWRVASASPGEVVLTAAQAGGCSWKVRKETQPQPQSCPGLLKISLASSGKPNLTCKWGCQHPRQTKLLFQIPDPNGHPRDLPELPTPVVLPAGHPLSPIFLEITQLPLCIPSWLPRGILEGRIWLQGRPKAHDSS